MKVMLAILLSLLSINCLANKILVTGAPIDIEVAQGEYTFPDSYIDDGKTMHFLSIMNIERVCFLGKQTALASLDMITVEIRGKQRKLAWDCYKFDPRYFEKDF